MRSIIVICLSIFIVVNVQSQRKHDYNWLFGYGTGIPDSSSPFGGIIMSFNNGHISFMPQARDFEFNIQTNSYSDYYGELKLMSNGCSIADESATVLPNGDSIGIGKVWGINCPKYQPLFQAGSFLNFNGVDSGSIVFLHTILDTIGNGLKYFLKCIYETKIDLNTKKVLLKNNVILYDTLYGSVATIMSGDNLKWWSVVPKYRSNEFYSILYDIKGTVNILKQNIGFKHDILGIGSSQLNFSPDGKKFAFYNPLIGLQVFDFDRETGLLSNFRFYGIIYPFNTVGGCGFSPDSRFVYVSNPTEVLQVDLLEQDSIKAIDTVGVFDNFFDPYPATYMQMALGPDCRIYITAGGGNQYLHVILYPNLKGKNCQLINRGLKLPTRNSHATPNFPHYRVDEPYPCDSTIRIKLNTDVDEAFKFREGDILLYPNPVKTELIVHDIRHALIGKIMIKLLSIQGQLIDEMQTNNTGKEIRIPISDLAKGLYIIQILDTRGKYLADKFVKE